MGCIKNRLVIMTAGFVVIACIRPLEPGLEIRNESLLLKDTFFLAKIEPEIIQAAERRRWKIEKLGPGGLKGKLNSRNRFDLTVDITFTTTVSIRYLDSRQLRFDGSDIHWKANKWMRDLRTSIIQRTAKLLKRSV